MPSSPAAAAAASTRCTCGRSSPAAPVKAASSENLARLAASSVCLHRRFSGVHDFSTTIVARSSIRVHEFGSYEGCGSRQPVRRFARIRAYIILAIVDDTFRESGGIFMRRGCTAIGDVNCMLRTSRFEKIPNFLILSNVQESAASLRYMYQLCNVLQFHKANSSARCYREYCGKIMRLRVNGLIEKTEHSSR